MLKILTGGIVVLLLLTGQALAQSCTSYPYPLTTGTTANGSDVISNLNYMGSCYAPLSNPSFTGSVGIGNNSPATWLEIGSSTANSNAVLTFGKTTTAAEALLPTISQVSTLSPGSGNDLDISANSSSGGLLFGTVGTTRMVIDASGNVRIGASTPAIATLTVNGTVADGSLAAGTSNSVCYAISSGYAVFSTCSSDQRLKQNIVSLNGNTALDQIMRLRPVSFDWNPDFSPDRHKQYGLLAQQVATVWPNLVSKTAPTKLTPDGTLSINFNSLYGPLIAAVQQLNRRVQAINVSDTGINKDPTLANRIRAQQVEIDQLKAANGAQEKIIHRLEANVAGLERRISTRTAQR